MKKVKLGIVIFGLWILTCCTIPREYTLYFCTNLNSDIRCEPSTTIFNTGARVYVLFECNQQFIEKTITGKIYYIEKSTKIEIDSQNWTINPGDSYACDFIDFTEPGTYEFEFLNENGVVLANKRLEIKWDTTTGGK